MTTFSLRSSPYGMDRSLLTDPSSFTAAFRHMQLIGEPSEDTVRIPQWFIVIVQPDCVITIRVR